MIQEGQNSKKLFEGHSLYSPLVLSLYDVFVLGFCNRFIWKCPTQELLALYNRNVSGNHLDIGVGSGYYLEAAHFPVSDPQITLLDLNENALNKAARRIKKYKPKKIVANILQDLPLDQTYSSIGLCYLLHCLSGGVKEKCLVFDRVLRMLTKGGRVFGATIVPGMNGENFASYGLIKFYNSMGVFSNEKDTFEDIEKEFRKRFEEARIYSHGSVVFVEGKAA